MYEKEKENMMWSAAICDCIGAIFIIIHILSVWGKCISKKYQNKIDQRKMFLLTDRVWIHKFSIDNYVNVVHACCMAW